MLDPYRSHNRLYTIFSNYTHHKLDAGEVYYISVQSEQEVPKEIYDVKWLPADLALIALIEKEMR